MSTRFISLGSLIVMMAIVIFIQMPVAAQYAEANEDIIIGKRATVNSEVLGEEREVWIGLPNGYERSAEAYPVLYLLDGNGHFHHAMATIDFLARSGRIPAMIVIAIPNTDRTRDLSPTHIEERASSGGAELFLQFMRDELFPYVEGNFRTQPYRLLDGHSLGGMFAVHTLINHPQMFQAHIAVSPYLMYDDGHVVATVDEKLASMEEMNHFLYFSVGNEPDYFETLDRFAAILTAKAPAGLKWDFVKMETDNHGTTPLKTLYQGLEFVYSGWEFADAQIEGGLPAIQKHFAELSKRYGYDILLPEQRINMLGYQLMGMGLVDDAIEAFVWNVKHYPESANVYDSLGEGYEANNQLEEAAKNYELAYNRGQEISDPAVNIYKEHLDAAHEKLAGGSQ